MKAFNNRYFSKLLQHLVHHHAQTGKKTISYFFIHMSVALLVSYAITQNIYMALSLSLIEPIVQTFAYAAHEHFWNRKDQKASSHLSTHSNASTVH